MAEGNRGTVLLAQCRSLRPSQHTHTHTPTQTAASWSPPRSQARSASQPCSATAASGPGASPALRRRRTRRRTQGWCKAVRCAVMHACRLSGHSTLASLSARAGEQQPPPPPLSRQAAPDPVATDRHCRCGQPPRATAHLSGLHRGLQGPWLRVGILKMHCDAVLDLLPRVLLRGCMKLHEAVKA